MIVVVDYLKTLNARTEAKRLLKRAESAAASADAAKNKKSELFLDIARAWIDLASKSVDK